MFGPNTTKNKATEQVDAFWLELSLKFGQISNGHIEALFSQYCRGEWQPAIYVKDAQQCAELL